MTTVIDAFWQALYYNKLLYQLISPGRHQSHCPNKYWFIIDWTIGINLSEIRIKIKIY